MRRLGWTSLWPASRPRPRSWPGGGPARRLAWLLVLALAIPPLIFWLLLPLVPLPPELFTAPPPPLDLVDRHGRPLRLVHASDQYFIRPVAYADLPQALVQATLAAEDQRFWRHPGVDWRATLRAAGQLLWHRRIISGGSTVTQQLVKLAHPRPRTFRVKLVEAIQALRLEQLWDKQRILAEYLNRIDYGNQNAGCAVAAEFYFAKPLRDLSPAECALLAGLPQGPTRLNPHKHFERARRRQQWILDRLFKTGWITAAVYARAKPEPLRLAPPQRVFEAPHFVDLILRQNPGLNHHAGGANADAGRPASPRPIVTSLDLELNRFASQTLRHHLARLQAQAVRNGAVVVIENRTGDVLGLVGSEDYFSPAAGQVNGAWAPRSAGSALKPFTYLLAFEKGATPASIVADVPTEFATATGLFAPVNYDRRYYGPMRYRVALANSLNISAVKVLADIGGPGLLQERLHAWGLSTLTRQADDYGLGLTIGNAEVRLLELANAYACLARLGEFKPCRLLQDSPAPYGTNGVADPAAAWLIADILADNAARTLAFGADSPLRFSFPVACKTGTSSNFRDNWAFGYTPEFTVGVWVGNFDGTPMRTVSGVTGAGPILHALFEHLHAQHGTSWYRQPESIVDCWVHPVTGKRLPHSVQAGTGPAIKEKFMASHLPPEPTSEDYDVRGRVRLGAEYADWLASGDNWLGGQAVCAEAPADLRIVFPLPGTVVYLDPDLPRHGSRLHLRAIGPAALTWSSASLQIVEDHGQPVARLTEGRHHLTVADAASQTQAQTWIDVVRR